MSHSRRQEKLCPLWQETNAQSSSLGCGWVAALAPHTYKTTLIGKHKEIQMANNATFILLVF